MANISFEGRLTADPEIKFGQDGRPRASFTVAENFRQLNRDTQQWEDSGVTFHRVTLFGRHAENPALVKGAVVTIAGTQKSRKYTNQSGEEKQWTETTANSFGVVPIQHGQSSPRTSTANVQGEGWGAQNSQSPVNNGQAWPAAAQPGSGQQWDQSRAQQGFDQPPF